METTELGGLLAGGSLFLLVALAYPAVLFVTAAAGGILVIYGSLQNMGRSPEPDSKPDLVECPSCHGLETPGRSTCRYCGDSLADSGSE